MTYFPRWSDVQLRRSAADFSEIVPWFGAFPRQDCTSITCPKAKRIVDGTPMYCVFHRADHDQWQFIAGGGEDNEIPLAAAERETFEEGGVNPTQ